ncbi:MAG: hypothetical protein IKO39_02600, partial [Treponema sp.]|nr:hypothetical protein [Treponema sp.]
MYNDGFALSAEKNPKSSPLYSGPNSYARGDDEPQIVLGKSVDDCKQKLFNMYHHNYRILGQRQVLKPGILGGLFGQKEYYEVRYTIGQPKTPSEQESFQKNRDEILNKAGSSVTNTIQIANIDKKLEEMKKTMEATMKNIAAATKTG